MAFRQNSSEFGMLAVVNECVLLGKGQVLAGNLNGKVRGHYVEEGDYIKGDTGLVVV